MTQIVTKFIDSLNYKTGMPLKFSPNTGTVYVKTFPKILMDAFCTTARCISLLSYAKQLSTPCTKRTQVKRA